MSLIFIFFVLVLLFIFLVPTLIVSIIARIAALFGFGRRNGAQQQSGPSSSEEARGGFGSARWGKNKKKKKIFPKDEGEYVDFEEIK